MSIIQRWCNAPSYPVAIDTSNPLTVGLISAYLLSTGEYYVDNDGSGYGRKNGRRSSAVAGKPYTLHGYYLNGVSEAPVVIADGGPALNFNGTAATVAASSSHPRSFTTPVTIITRVFLRNTSSPQVIVGSFNGTLSPVYQFGLGLYIEANTLYGVGANNNARVLTATAPPTGEWVTLALVTNTASGKLFIDKQMVASGTLAGASSGYVFTIGCAGAQAYGSTAPATLDGMVGPTLVFNRALSDFEIMALSDNPYQVLTPSSVPLWWGAVVSSTTSVNNTADIVWNAINAVESQNNSSWNLLNSTENQQNNTWDVLNSASADSQLFFDIINSATESSQLNWNLVSSTSNNKEVSWDTLTSVSNASTESWDILSSSNNSATLNWDLLQNTQNTKQIDWAILSNAEKNLISSWDILNSIVSNKNISWDMLSVLLSAQNSVATNYDILSSAAASLSNSWNTLSSALKYDSINWDILSTVENTESIQWGIVNAISKDLVIASSVLGIAVNDLQVVWDSIRTVEGVVVIQYSITNVGILPPLSRTVSIQMRNSSIAIPLRKSSVVIN